MKIRAIVAALACGASLCAGIALADGLVPGYVLRDGTYVPPHYRSESNDRMYDRYLSRSRANADGDQRTYERNELSKPLADLQRQGGDGSVYKLRPPQRYDPPSQPYKPPSL